MSAVASSDALALVQRVETTVGFPTNPICGFFYCVSWMWRKVLWIPDMIKKFMTISRHPTAYGLGVLLSRGGLFERGAWIIVAARIVSVVRPLIDLSASCTKVKADAKALVKSVWGDKQVARVFFQVKGFIKKSFLLYPFIFCRYVIPTFLQRAKGLIVNSGKVGWHAYDSYEALRADDAEVIERSIAEIQEVLDQVGDGRLLQAIDFHKVWLKELLCKFKTNIDLDKVKETIVRIGRGDEKGFLGQAVSDAFNIVWHGILGIGRK